jgi:hypothetical protein
MATSVCLYRINQDGDLVVNPKYIKLWDLLTNYVGESNNLGGFDTTTFALPKISQSTLRSVSSLSSPGSKVRLVTFHQTVPLSPGATNFPGPITNEGFALRIYGNLLKYRVSWNILSSQATSVGFYTSSDFMPGVLNQLYLICGSRGPALFRETTGSFLFTGDMNMYVVIDRDVPLELKVEVVIPKRFFSPELTQEPYTKYLELTKCGTRYQVPVYTSQAVPESYLIVTKPTEQFQQLYDLMLQYLEKTRLNLTLYPDLILPSKLRAVSDDPFRTRIYKDVPAHNYRNAYSDGATIAPIKDQDKGKDVGGPTWNSGNSKYIDVCYTLAEHLLENRKFPKITVDITVGRSFYSFKNVQTLPVTIQKYSSGWQYQTNVDISKGIPSGKCYDKHELRYDLPDNFTSTFILDQEATYFNVTLYLESYRKVAFNSIEVSYVTMP